MKKLLVLTVVSLFALAIMAAPALAAKGGMPAAHGLSGKDFGAATSALAQSAPGAVAAHHGAGQAAGGMPAAHGLTGAEFGAATSALAQSAPGAVAAHHGAGPN
jgi:hypothetical protein